MVDATGTRAVYLHPHYFGVCLLSLQLPASTSLCLSFFHPCAYRAGSAEKLCPWMSTDLLIDGIHV